VGSDQTRLRRPRLPPVKPTSKTRHKPAASTRLALLRITGLDLVAVDGLSASLTQTILTQIGADMRQFPPVKHFAAWLELAPHQDISGGKALRSHTLPPHNRAGPAFRQAAASLARSDPAFGPFFRRNRAPRGPHPAIVATAHQIARPVYTMRKHRTPYQDVGAETYAAPYREQELNYLKRKAAKLGVDLMPQDAVLVATAT
jgi:hypothetical protein